jgi:hypothetical protein
LRYTVGMRQRITLGTILAAFVGFLEYGGWIFDWLSRVDFIVSREANPGWLGAVARFLGRTPMILAALPPWSPWVVMIAGLAFITWDSRRLAAKNRNAVVVASQAMQPEGDKHLRVSKWLTNRFSDPHLRVRHAALFGSIVHDHYPTSDVDLVLLFNPRPNRNIAKLVRTTKGDIATTFCNTFGHRLHVTFFCAHEEDDMKKFLSGVGKHETIIDKQ